MVFRDFSSFIGSRMWVVHKRKIWQLYQHIRHLAVNVNDHDEMYRLYKMCEQDRGVYLSKLEARGYKITPTDFMKYTRLLRLALENSG